MAPSTHSTRYSSHRAPRVPLLPPRSALPTGWSLGNVGDLCAAPAATRLGCSGGRAEPICAVKPGPGTKGVQREPEPFVEDIRGRAYSAIRPSSVAVPSYLPFVPSLGTRLAHLLLLLNDTFSSLALTLPPLLVELFTNFVASPAIV